MSNTRVRVTKGPHYVYVDVDFDIASNRWKVRMAPVGCAWPTHPANKKIELFGSKIDQIIGFGPTIDEAMRDFAVKLMEFTS